MRNTALLLINSPDRQGLVAAVATLLYRYGANITHADQQQDHQVGLFFMRVEWALEGFDLSAFQAEFQTVAVELQMQWQLQLMSQLPRAAVFVSQHLHCLVDLLHRHSLLPTSFVSRFGFGVLQVSKMGVLGHLVKDGYGEGEEL